MRPLLPALLVGTLLMPLASHAAEPSSELKAGIEAYNTGRYEDARHPLEDAAGRGEAEAMVNLGYMYTRGQGGPANPVVALILYRRAASLGDAEGMNAIGYRYAFTAHPDYDQAIPWFCRAIAGGNPRGMNNLANLLYNGQGIGRDPAEARNLWRQAAARGGLSALSNLGFSLARDPGMTESERAEGVRLLQQAARRGADTAQRFLRSIGDTEPFPPAIDSSLPMQLEARPPQPGSTSVCGGLVS